MSDGPGQHPHMLPELTCHGEHRKLIRGRRDVAASAGTPSFL